MIIYSSASRFPYPAPLPSLTTPKTKERHKTQVKAVEPKEGEGDKETTFSKRINLFVLVPGYVHTRTHTERETCAYKNCKIFLHTHRE